MKIFEVTFTLMLLEIYPINLLDALGANIESLSFLTRLSMLKIYSHKHGIKCHKDNVHLQHNPFNY